jgi:hypothetical protein
MVAGYLMLDTELYLISVYSRQLIVVNQENPDFLWGIVGK